MNNQELNRNYPRRTEYARRFIEKVTADKETLFLFDFATHFRDYYPDYKFNTTKAYRDYLKDRQEIWKDVLSSEEIEIMTQIIEKFFIEDNINYDAFYKNYHKKYSPFDVSPYIPRWFFACYPEFVKFISNPSKETYKYLQELQTEQNISFDANSDASGFSVDVLYKMKEFWKKYPKNPLFRRIQYIYRKVIEYIFKQ